MDHFLYKLGKIPGALMILPLFAGALINTFAPQILNIGSFTTALFKNGVPVLIGLFFMCIGSQIRLRAALPAVEKGLGCPDNSYIIIFFALKAHLLR
ncbi:2-keto-3-deoxygluconate permease [Uruburuella testudinis]|uniref:2-keto-3-deoxygluconate permease n=1 Tax=Uruburuella testudinis TaxID=1282863 RepID=A0ABY4DSZ8_9NEIS|nr:2-keto-3-deoxygluconate permease [Uruburuella testudinis]UOO81538.1 2-keto-3-deoxygluconate permease [Uruburuella testudinis]